MSRSLRSCLLLLGMLAPPATTYLLSSCTLVNEPVVSFAKNSVGHCVRDCRKAFAQSERECAKDLRRAAHECRRVPAGPDQDACLREAVEGFASCTNAAVDERRACLNGCHQQGGGGGE